MTTLAMSVTLLGLAGCGANERASSLADANPAAVHPNATTATKSAKRGIAYDLASSADLAALSPGVSWWYNWTSTPHSTVPSDYVTRYGMDYYPMLWNGNFSVSTIESFLKFNPQIKYLLVPNLTGQSDMTPTEAAKLWPQYEAIAAEAGVMIVGPQITWGNMANYGDPVVWMDAFYAAYRAANGGRSPRIDFLGFHWYDYGLDSQLNRLTKYGKPFWVTEFANWHGQNDGAQIDTLAKQEAQMQSMVSTCETRSDVFATPGLPGASVRIRTSIACSARPGSLRLWEILPFSPTLTGLRRSTRSREEQPAKGCSSRTSAWLHHERRAPLEQRDGASRRHHACHRLWLTRSILTECIQKTCKSSAIRLKR